MKTMRPGEVILSRSLAHITKELNQFKAMEYIAESPLGEAILRPEPRHFETSRAPPNSISIKVFFSWFSYFLFSKIMFQRGNYNDFVKGPLVNVFFFLKLFNAYKLMITVDKDSKSESASRGVVIGSGGARGQALHTDGAGASRHRYSTRPHLLPKLQSRCLNAFCF